MHRSATPPSTSWPTLACSVPSAVPSTRAGALVITASARCSPAPESWPHLSASPAAAPARWRRARPRQTAASWRLRPPGVWSDTSASMVPSASAARRASRSRCWRSGGFSRARLSKVADVGVGQVQRVDADIAGHRQALGLGLAHQGHAGGTAEAAQVHACAGGAHQLKRWCAAQWSRPPPARRTGPGAWPAGRWRPRPCPATAPAGAATRCSRRCWRTAARAAAPGC
jgi:hypothetical protein